MSAASPIEPRSPAVAGGVLDFSEPTGGGGRLWRRLAAGVYGLLWVAAALLWTAPVSAYAAAVARSVLEGRDPLGSWLGAGVGAGPAVFGAIWASIRTARSRRAHRGMLLWGGLAAVLLAGGAAYWHGASARARDADPDVMLVGLIEILLAMLCGVTAGGCVALFLAGAWGRWVLHREAMPGADGHVP